MSPQIITGVWMFSICEKKIITLNENLENIIIIFLKKIKIKWPKGNMWCASMSRINFFKKN
jgi:hypothetical protein